MGAVAEKAGIPAVSIVSDQFVQLVKAAAQGEGLSSLPAAVIPHMVMSDANVDCRPACEAVIKDIVYALTKWQPEEGEGKEEGLVFEGKDYQDAVDKMNSFFLSQLWGDGFPLLPATRERVDWILTGTDLPRNQVFSTKFAPRYGMITVENAAINAAMAGARPEYMPVILAALDLLATDAGLKLLYYCTISVTNQAPLLIVNGPIAKELNINSSYGLMGPGWRANATIGRTLSLLLSNGAGAHVKAGGNLVCQSLPGRYTWCFAENEQENPWEPLHVELGYDPNISTVSVMTGRGTQLIFVRPPAEQILNMIAHAVQGATGRRYGMPWDQLLILGPAHAETLAEAGWSKKRIRDFVYEKARISLADADAAGFFRPRGEWERRLANVTDKNILVPMMGETPEDLTIVVAGGGGAVSSTFVPCMMRRVTGQIDKYKPRNWDALIKRMREEE